MSFESVNTTASEPEKKTMDHSQKPQFKYPEFKYRGHINEDLAGRYDWLVRDLEKTVKDDTAAAHRTSTQLRNTCERFQHALSAEQTLALKAAASSMARLARELEELKPWAKAKVAHLKTTWAAREKFNEEIFANERWGGDEAAMMTELAAAKAFVNDEGNAWLVQKYDVTQAHVLYQDADHLNRLNPQSTSSEARTTLVKFLESLRHAQSETDSRTGRNGEVTTTRWAGWHDYSMFLAARTGADASARAVLDKLSKAESSLLQKHHELE